MGSKVAPGSTVVLVGVADPEPAPLTLASFFGHENAVIRSYFSYAQPGAAGEDLATLTGLLADGRLTAPIGLRASWDQTGAALGALADGKVDGKAVLDVR
jgi:NADPH2:quinone reductase